MVPTYSSMGPITEPTYEDFVASGSFRDISGRERRKMIKLLLETGITTDFNFLAQRCRESMPKLLPINKPKKRAGILKKIGERYTGHCIELWLWEKGYALNGLGKNSFTIEPQYCQNHHRIDFRVVITTSKSNIILVVDSKNWARYSTKKAKSYIKMHIQPFNSFTANHKLMFLNNRLIPKVKKILQINNVEPIEILHHLTHRNYITNHLMLVISMKKSIQNMDNLISIPDVSKKILNLTPTEIIKYDIELGKPYKLIEEKWKISHSYIHKLRRQMVHNGACPPDRNTEVFTRLKQYNYYFKRK
jgi:hypothetical protein